MLPLLSILMCLTALTQAAQCPAYDRVKAGVFQPNDDFVDFNRTLAACACHNAAVASLEQVYTANNRSYESCKWGWVKEQKVVMARSTADEKCANSSTGVVPKMPCVDIDVKNVFCFKRNVVMGVFQIVIDKNDTGLTPQNAAIRCESANATVATRFQMERASSSGYVTCSAGWVKDVNGTVPYQFYNTSGANCNSNNSTDSNNSTNSNNSTDSTGPHETRAVFCFREELMDTGVYTVSAENGSPLANKSEARSLCVSLLDNLATVAQIKNSSNSADAARRQNLRGWCQEGVVKTGENGTAELLACVNYPDVNATVFCYDPNLPDTTPLDTLWKKIAMGCILASIFVILLIAALFMRGNQFICCIEKPHPVNVESLNEVGREASRRRPSVPTWNTTGIYHPVKEAIDPRYDRNFDVLPEPRPPAIRPEMLHYRSHIYDNLGYDKAADE